LYCLLSTSNLAAQGDPSGREGQLIVQYCAGMNEGMVRGRVGLDLTQPNPMVHLQRRLYEVQMDRRLRPLVEDFFPGMTVLGKIVIDEEEKSRLFDYPEDVPNYPAGRGEMVFRDGYLVGKAAPDWVTRIFPGLNFARYNFSRMHNWFEKTPDGRVHNNMIFRGWPWNIYMEGDSYADGWTDYEVGVDLLARFESEYWSSVGQGRVPIFRSRGRIVNRKFEDQKVTYVPLHRVVYQVMVKNNVLTAAYRVIRRRLDKR